MSQDLYDSYKAGMESHSVEALLAQYNGTKVAIEHYTTKMNQQYALQAAAATLLVDKLDLHPAFRDDKITTVFTLMNFPLTEKEKEVFSLIANTTSLLYYNDYPPYNTLIEVGLTKVEGTQIILTWTGIRLFESEHLFIKALVS